MTQVGDAVLWARTARHLHPSQVLHRARLRTQRAVVALAPHVTARRLSGPLPARWGWPPSAVPLDGMLPEGQPPGRLATGTFRFLDETRELGAPADWCQAGADRLWRFHLHYLEWGWAFHAAPDRSWARREFAGLWRSWHEGTPFGRGDGWAPYVVSLRSWAMCGLHQSLVAGSDVESAYVRSLVLHAGFLRAHLELDVGGNHLVKNLKALVGLGVFLGDDPMVKRACNRLDRELAVQVLSDGGHFERSPPYHCQVLGDLVDVCDLLDAVGVGHSEAMAEAVVAMRRWLGTVVMPDGDVPLFNDGGLVGTERVGLLRPTEPEAVPLTVLSPSGYAVIRPGGDVGANLHLVADVGPPCPPELPAHAHAHAHADCLSFELAVGDHRIVVSAGTSTYAPGARRAYERSTRAHTTVEVDGADQTEVWSRFLAARRAMPTLERAGEREATIEIVASHDGYRRLPGRPVHRRTWTVAPDRIEIVDDMAGGGHHRVVSSMHLAPGCAVAVVDDAVLEAGPLRLAFDGPPGTTVEVAAPGTDPDGWVATGFGDRRPAATVRVSVEGELPVRLRTTVTVRASG